MLEPQEVLEVLLALALSRVRAEVVVVLLLER